MQKEIYDVKGILEKTGWSMVDIIIDYHGELAFYNSGTYKSISAEDIMQYDPELALSLQNMHFLPLNGISADVNHPSSKGCLCRIPIPQSAGRFHYLIELSEAGGIVADYRLRKAKIALSEYRRDSFREIEQSCGCSPPETDDVIPIYKSFDPIYAFYKWVHNAQLVECVLSGRYDRIRPVSAEITPTLNCTFRCSKCSFKQPKEQIHSPDGLSCWEKNFFKDSAVQMQNSAIMFGCIDRLVEVGVTSAVFTGGGEPLLCEYTIPGMQYAKEKGIDIALYTNGSLLTEDMVSRISSISPNIIRISLNAGTASNHREFHNYLATDEDYFSRILTGIELLARQRLQKADMQLGVGVLANKINIGKLGEVARCLSDITQRTGGGIDYVVIRPELDYFGGEQLASELCMHATEELDRYVKPVLAENGIKVFGIPLRWKAMQFGKDYSECRANSVFAEVGPNGDLFLCCERNFLKEFRIGNLLDQSIDEIWDGTQRQCLMNSVNEILKGRPLNHLPSCPPACKPHPLNSLFHQVENMRKNGRIKYVEQWIELLKRLPKPLDRIL